MAHCRVAIEIFADMGNMGSRLHPRVDARLLQRILQRQRVHHRGQHAHRIGGRAIHPGQRTGGTAEQVAAADHDADLHARSATTSRI